MNPVNLVSPGPETSPREPSVSTVLLDALHRLGVTHAFGVMGGAIAPFFRALHDSPIRCVNFRHEAGAAFAAVEASLATRRPVVVFTTAGPGVANALTGMAAARWDGAHVIFVSAATSLANRGRVATQETSAATLGASLFTGGGVLHYATSLEHPAQLAPVVAHLGEGVTRAGGYVAHVSLPIDVQNATAVGRVRLVDHGDRSPPCSPRVIEHHAALVRGGGLVLWVGFGARHAAEPVRRLAELTGARVMCSPRGKGIFPEDHPQFIGVTGLGGHPEVDDHLTHDRPAYTLVLGTRMGESTSFWGPELTPSEAFLHVDTDPAAFGAAYPEVMTHGAVADVGRYCTALAAALATRPPPRTAPRPAPSPRPRAAARTTGPVRPQHLFAEVQRVFVDDSDAWIMAESGNAFCWSSHLLRFTQPGRYRVSTGYGSMGHATTAVVGAAVARDGKAVALVGDGAMLMANEVHAAVQYRADAVWIVLNDARYLICEQGMRAMGWQPFACELSPVDFVAMARALGAGGERVTCEAEVGAALERAAAARGPWVVDVAIDPSEVAPSGRRNRSLMQQGMNHLTETR